MRLFSQNKILRQITEAELDTFKGCHWRGDSGTPTHYIRRGKSITLYPIPLFDDALALSVSVIPDDDFDFEDDIEPAYRKGLLYYMAYKAYLLNDADTYNAMKAGDFLKLFDGFFGLPHSAKWKEIANESPVYGSIYGGRLS